MTQQNTDHRAPPSEELIADRFRDAGVRVTRQRLLIYQNLCSLTTHPTAEQLLDEVRGHDERVSLATVYNTLETLISHGLVQRIAGNASGSACRFEADTSEHVHMVLPDGCVHDVPKDLSAEIISAIPEATLKRLSKRMDVSIDSIKIDLVCSTTQA